MIVFSHMDNSLPKAGGVNITSGADQQNIPKTATVNTAPTDLPIQSAQPSIPVAGNTPSPVNISPGQVAVQTPQAPTGSLFKEGAPRVAEQKEFTPPAEVKEWVQEIKTAEEITLPQPVKDEFGEILLEAASPIKPKIVLPLTKPKIKQGLHKKIAESIRWLAEWCLRLIKMFPDRIQKEVATS